MDNIFVKSLYGLYDKNSFLDKYGGSVVVTALILIIFFIITSYFSIMNKLKPIKNNWAEMKCHPGIIPFAGMIMQPKTQTNMEFTANNFAFCTNRILADIVGFFLTPLYYSMGMITELFAELVNSVQVIRNLFSYLRDKFALITEYVYTKIFTVIIPLQKILIKIKDGLSKTTGALAAVIYTTLTSFFAITKFFRNFLETMHYTFAWAAVIILFMWTFPFTQPMAMLATVTYIILWIPSLLVMNGLKGIVKLSTTSMPPPPGAPSACFDKNTPINTTNGSVPIKNLKKGTVLLDGSKVTSTMKMALNGQKMYKLNDIIVSETHKVFHETLGWIFPQKHPNSILVQNYREQFIYCFNTDTKRIKIKNEKFLDWDELEPIDIINLKKLNYLQENSSMSDIHKYLDAGLYKNTLIELDDGRSIPIKKIEVNDQLKYGERVLGIVRIDAKNIHSLYKYFITKDFSIVGAPNIIMNDVDLGNLIPLNNPKLKTLYHIITDTGDFTINGFKIKDYNSALENILDIREKLNILN